MSEPAANNIPPGITVFCDPTLRAAIRALDPISRVRIGAPVSALSAPAASMLAQIQRHTRNDVLFTLSIAMDQAVDLQLVKPTTRIDGFSNALVLASRTDAMPAKNGDAYSFPFGSRIGVTDYTVASGLDGMMVLKDNGFAPSRSVSVIGAATTEDVVFLLTTGFVNFGLVYLTDVHTNPELTTVSTLNAAPSLTEYSCAVNANAVSPNAQALVRLIRSNEGIVALARAGLAVS